MVTNSGGTAVSNGTVSVTGPYTILSGTPFSIPGFGATNVVVQFAPVTVGGFTNNVIFASANGGNSTNAVTGTGLTAGSITVTPASYGFGTQVTGTTAQTTFVVTNSGGTTVTNGTASSTAPFSIVAGTPFSVAAFGSTNVTVQFAPTSAGTFTQNVIFTTANGGNSTNTVTGTGASHPANFTWTNSSSGYWQSTTAWTPAGDFPGAPGTLGTNDSAFFTNAATYSVTLTNDVSVSSNVFRNAANTLATVTLNLGTNALKLLYTGTTAGAFTVADIANSTTTVYLASSTVPGKGLVVNGPIYLGNNGIGTVFVTNGNVFANASYTYLCWNAGSRGTLVLSGSGSVWSNAGQFFVGYNNGSRSSLVISNGGTMFDYKGWVGEIGMSNSAWVCGSGSVWSNQSDLHVGFLSSGNSLVISNGGTVFNNSGDIGYGGGTSNNVLVSGSGSVWSNQSDLYVGYQGRGNSLVISNGGTVFNKNGWISDYDTNNSVLVSGSGSVWNNRGTLTFGQSGGSSNSLVISNGGAVVNSFGYIGNSGNANSVLVSDNGSVWTNQCNLFVGYSGSGNSLTISNGGTVVSSNLYMGFNPGSATNLVTLNGGNLIVANASGNGVLNACGGTFTMNSGTATVDGFAATNGTSSVVNFNGGTMNTKSTTVNNGSTFTVGNGSSVATLNLASGSLGFHSFANGLTIFTNATLEGIGTVLGATTVNPGGTLSPGLPGLSPGTMTFSNNLVVNNGAVSQYTLGTNSAQTVVSSNLTLGGTLNITNSGGFTNKTTYTLFTYGGALTYNGLTVGTTPNANFTYAISTNVPGHVDLLVDGGSPPVASFTGSPTSGTAPMAVTFTDRLDR